MSSKRRTNIFVRIAIVLAIIFFIYQIIAMQIQLADLKEQKQALELELDVIAENIDEMNLRIDMPITEEYIRKVAREKLNYRDSDEIIFYNDITD